ncbi:hypothetical protein IMY05_016G0078500 [Salix suchowensis]|nr:hypothetical protein IMY05_016G0078500 [Salix suchowensis]
MEGKGKGKKEQAAINVWDCGSPLYDSYEIASLGHLIDRHSLALSSPCGPEKEGGVVIDYASMPRDQEKGLPVRKEGLLSRIIRIFIWKRTMIKERKDRKVRKPVGLPKSIVSSEWTDISKSIFIGSVEAQ